ncbi:hypothetical protein, partial [Planococcus soli]|uniref:hypothetical protein n=1 Tax=Planococcus soli TaxID=2666072 RepID=UPI001944859E
FVDVLLFSFQGSISMPPFRLCCSLLLGDFYYIKACLYSCQHFLESFYRNRFFPSVLTTPAALLTPFPLTAINILWLLNRVL